MILLSESIFFGILPLKWSKIRNSAKVLAILNSFSAGVFLAIGIAHILPEAAETYNSTCEGECFPLPYFLVVAGYALILLLDKVAFGGSHSFVENDHNVNADEEA